MQNEKEYIIFILGYDLLNDILLDTSGLECDTAYEKCTKIADDFLESEFNNFNKSLYDCLIDYIESERYAKFLDLDNELDEKEEVR